MSTATATMTNFFNVLKLYAYDTTTNGVTILDQAVKTVSRFSSLQDAVNNFVYDMASVTATAGARQSLYQNCGIVLGANYDYTADTGAVTGYNAGNSLIKNAQDIVPENALLTQVAYPASTITYHTYTGNDGQTFSFALVYPSSILEVRDDNTGIINAQGYYDTSYAQNVYLQPGQWYYDYPDEDGYYYVVSYAEAIAGIYTMMTGIENFWATEGLKLAYDSFGLDFNGKNLHIVFGINSDYQAATGPTALEPNHDNYLPANDIEIEINMPLYAIIDAADPNGNTNVYDGSYQNYLDRTIAHELIHAVMFATGTLKDGMPEFFTEGVAELVHGLDDYDGNYSDLILSLASDANYLARSLPFEPGTGTSEAYPAGYMFLRYLCHESLNTQVSIGNGTTPELFGYTGGEEIISGAASGSQINLDNGIAFAGISVDTNDLTVATSAGQIIVRGARDKIVNFADAYGNVFERGYFASGSGTVDGRGLSGTEILYGGNFSDNTIYAGDDGSQLWGGIYGNDILCGGAGADEFIAGTACGSDVIYNANAGDTVNLSTTSLTQLVDATINANGVFIQTSDNSSVAVMGEVGSAFRFAGGEIFTVDQTSGQWNRLA
ncbi:MAG: hypothetical protein IJ685_12475 [Selenomonadaceae bacterium]|nr:hypothetical protein [Selenomonadaceae bacterium]